eukprot:TRINITY_DN93461_c0_g1_i1.p1 TRINITY_DN93461_c0_g1~~TRINITY_DN93461_c0_g1_i1.p1  ORF type:complete len:1023 (-),score=209.22 TRINITY_DN93461_c0_g1_i1:144-3212(-)
MMNFFGWHGHHAAPTPASALSPAASRPDVSHSAPTGEVSVKAATRIFRACSSAEGHAFLRPVAATLGRLGDLYSVAVSHKSAVRNDLREDLEGAARFLARCEQASQHLDFGLAAHREPESTRKFFGHVEAVLLRLAKDPSSGFDEASILQWRAHEVSFAESCRELWETHLYFIFLDVKGDRALFEQVFRHLCSHLSCRVSALVKCFEYSRRWVEEALHILAEQQERQLLQQLHTAHLRRWRTLWYDRATQMNEGHRVREDAAQQHSAAGMAFWEQYFTHLFKITWPDFVEAFEHFYLVGPGRLPVDLMNQLRLRVDFSLVHQVTRASWQRLLEEVSSIPALIDSLLDEVVGDVDLRIYRQQSLKSVVTARPRLASHAAAEFHGDPCEPSSSSSSGCHALPGSRNGSSSMAQQQTPLPPGGPIPSEPKPKPWFPFAASMSDDADMAVPTPHDLRLRQGGLDVADDAGEDPTAPAGQKQAMAWDEYTARLCAGCPVWWGAPGEVPLLAGLDRGDEPLPMAALRAVSSSVAYTQRALIFRVVSGDLAQNMPVLEVAERRAPLPAAEREAAQQALLPSLVVTARGTRFSGVTKFGRTSSRRTLLPDCAMSEPIASRSHFNVVYEQETDKFYLMDAGSKWGTFVKIGSSVTLSCGDWIRVGGVEFIIRYCGGGCACRKRHAHYRLHSLRLLRDHQASATSVPRWPVEPSSDIGEDPERANCLHLPAAHSAHDLCGMNGVSAARSSCGKTIPELPTSASWHALSEGGMQLQRGRCADDDFEAAESSDEDEGRARQSQDDLLVLLSSRRPRGWAAAGWRLFQQAAMRTAGTPPVGLRRQCQAAEQAAEGSRLQFASHFACRPSTVLEESGASPPGTSSASKAEGQALPSLVPIQPLELDFISGPRMGEKVVLNERVCTLGRGEGNTVQVSDSQLASVSRVHCIFEYRGNRWQLRDNGSTNGTWRRLSCVLEPSEPIPLCENMSIQAGVHEFLVEEVDMRHWWMPSMAASVFEELAEQERRERKAASVLA